MTITMTPTRLNGYVMAPPSKSQAHRLIIAAALAEGESRVRNVEHSQDIEATLRCIRKLGAQAYWERDIVVIQGMAAGKSAPDRSQPLPQLNCGESGSTLRFLIPIALAVRGGGVFTGSPRLMERPQKPYLDLFQEKGISFERDGGVLNCCGKLEAGIWALPGNVSSQFFTGLLYALPLLDGESYLKSTTTLQSSSYLDMTRDALKLAGVETEAAAGYGFLIKGGQSYQPIRANVEADWSQAGFWLTAAGLGNNVTVSGLSGDSTQGDRVIMEWRDLLERDGDVELDVSDCPDLVPPLAVLACLREGQATRIVNAGRLRMKESDRLVAVREELNKMGARVTEGEDYLVIEGVGSLKGALTDSHNDHRIAMMIAIAATRAEGPVTLTGAECVAKSYPEFWEEYARLGGAFKEEKA